MQIKVTDNSALKLFVEVGRQIRKAQPHQADIFQKVVATIGENLELDRCVVMVFNEKTHELKVNGEYCRIPCKPLEQGLYSLFSNSECYELLLSGKPLPLTVIGTDVSQSRETPELTHFTQLSDSKSILAFPMIAEGRLLGVLFMHFCLEQKSFPDSYFELGESIASELALLISKEKPIEAKDDDGSLTDFPHHTTQTSTIEQGNDFKTSDQIGKLEETVTSLTKQLNWERIVRHIVSMIYASLDRDTVLQTTADSLGRVLGASRCLVVRIEELSPPTVTHEYVQAEISPLGLGRTSQFPQGVISCFRQQSRSIPDILDEKSPVGFSSRDLEYMEDNNIRALLGTPIFYHNVLHGAIIVVQNERTRQWSNQEVELMETIADQVAVALNHAHSYSQIKDQLFNMSLLGNLTQQLTNALDAISRQTNVSPDDARPQAIQPSPLSLREHEVLKLIASGLANREIAQKLFLTESTVELHASRIRKKLKLKSRTALVKYACDNKLV